MAIAPASKSAARTAASDLNQLAVRWLELFSTTGESLISSINQTEECRKHQNKARPVSTDARLKNLGQQIADEREQARWVYRFRHMRGESGCQRTAAIIVLRITSHRDDRRRLITI